MLSYNKTLYCRDILDRLDIITDYIVDAIMNLNNPNASDISIFNVSRLAIVRSIQSNSQFEARSLSMLRFLSREQLGRATTEFEVLYLVMLNS